MKIVDIKAREILDSRGNPTVSCSLILDDGTYVDASVPSGASVGVYEALELRDGGMRFAGKGVQKAIDNIHTIITPAFMGRAIDAVQMDKELALLDPSPQKNVLGANATLAVSMALYKAHASMLGVELYSFIAHTLGLDEIAMPVPLVNMINGGCHAHNNLSIQEYLVIPYGSLSFAQSVEQAFDITQALKTLLKKNNKELSVGDEGGFSCTFTSNTEPFDYLMQAIENAGYSEREVALGVDVAASAFYSAERKKYQFAGELLSTDQLIALFEKLVAQYPIIYIEDGLDQDDWCGWQVLKKVLGEQTRIVGDDLLTTSRDRVQRAVLEDAINGVILKPNQIGTVTECLDVARCCKENGLVTIASHRSGETCDTFIADFALGIDAHYIKCGGLSRGERVAKYNRLLQIESMR